MSKSPILDFGFGAIKFGIGGVSLAMLSIPEVLSGNATFDYVFILLINILSWALLAIGAFEMLVSSSKRMEPKEA